MDMDANVAQLEHSNNKRYASAFRLYTDILPKLFSYCSLLELNNYNVYMYAIYNCCFL